MNAQDNVSRRGWVMRLYLWACDRLYDELAGQYDRVSWLVSLGQWRRWQRGVWDEVRGCHVLELGCGTGAMLVDGTQRGLKMVGIDLSPMMLMISRKRLSFARSNNKLVRGDGMSLPLAEAEFDTVVATFPAGYILAPPTLQEVRRVLRPQGRFVVIGLWVKLHLGLVAQLLPIFYGEPTAEVRSGIVQLMEGAGFEVRWVMQRHGIFTVGGLVATPMDDADGDC